MLKKINWKTALTVAMAIKTVSYSDLKEFTDHIDDRERLAAVNFLVSQLLEQMDVSSKDIIYAALHSSISDAAVVNNLTEEALKKGKSFVKFSDRLGN